MEIEQIKAEIVKIFEHWKLAFLVYLPIVTTRENRVFRRSILVLVLVTFFVFFIFYHIET